MRAFLALPLGAELGARVGELVQRTLALNLVAEHLRFARPEGLHLTLAFLGNVAGEGLAQVPQSGESE